MLNQKFTLYVPGTVNVDEHLSESEHDGYARHALSRMLELFGGATADAYGAGAYVSPTRGIVIERIIKVHSFTDDAGAAKLGELLAYAAELAQNMGQEAIAVEVNGTLQFVQSTALQAAA